MKLEHISKMNLDDPNVNLFIARTKLNADMKKDLHDWFVSNYREFTHADVDYVHHVLRTELLKEMQQGLKSEYDAIYKSLNDCELMDYAIKLIEQDSDAICKTKEELEERKKFLSMMGNLMPKSL